MIIDFAGGSRADAHFGDFTVSTDQPPEPNASSPFDYLLGSIGTCAGIYVVKFYRERGIPTHHIRILERTNHIWSGAMMENIDLEIQGPPDFPENYHDSLIHATELCTVKKHLEKPLHFNVTTAVVEPPAPEEQQP